MTGMLKKKYIGQVDALLIDGKTWTEAEIKALIKANK